MKPIGKALLELRTVLLGIGLFNSGIDSMVILLFTLLGLVLLGLPWEISLIPFGAYFFIHTRKVLKGLGYSDVETRVPQLREALRTAADNLESENEVVRALNEEVLQKMRLVQTSAFIGFSKVIKQLLIICMLCFAIITVSALDIHFVDGSDLLGRAGILGSGLLTDSDARLELFGKMGKKYTGPGQIQEVTLIDESELYGNETVIELGTDELNLELNPEGTGVKIGDVKPPENREFTNQPDATDVAATADSTYSEEIPKEYQSIVRNYFQSIPK